MRKFIFSLPRGILIAFLFIITTTFFLVIACRKIDHKKDNSVNESDNRAKFFSVKPGTDPIVLAIAASIKR